MGGHAGHCTLHKGKHTRKIVFHHSLGKAVLLVGEYPKADSGRGKMIQQVGNAGIGRGGILFVKRITGFKGCQGVRQLLRPAGLGWGKPLTELGNTIAHKPLVFL